MVRFMTNNKDILPIGLACKHSVYVEHSAEQNNPVNCFARGPDKPKTKN